MIQELNTREQRKEFYHSIEWQRLREQALRRDNYECLWCKASGRVSEGVLEVDHIKDIEHYPEEAMNLANLRTLCKDCHNKRHNRMNYARNKKHRKPPKWDDERWDYPPRGQKNRPNSTAGRPVGWGQLSQIIQIFSREGGYD